MREFLNEKQLRYLSKAVLEDIKGINPNEKKNVFQVIKNGLKFNVNHIVYGTQFYKNNDFEKWSESAPHIHKIGRNKYKFEFVNFHMLENINTSFEFNGNIEPSELYILIAELQDNIENTFNEWYSDFKERNKKQLEGLKAV